MEVSISIFLSFAKEMQVWDYLLTHVPLSSSFINSQEAKDGIRFVFTLFHAFLRF